MAELIVDLAGCSLNKNQLDSILNELNLMLPEELYEFYLRFNNSQSFRQKYHINGSKIRGWFCFETDACKNKLLNLSFQANFYHSRDFLPPYLIPFAYNDMDDYFLVSLKSSDYGSVYFLRTDMYFEEDGALSFLNKSLTEFTDSLKVSHDNT